MLHLFEDPNFHPDTVRLDARMWDHFRVGPTDVVAAPDHLGLQGRSYPSFESAANAVQRAREGERRVIWDKWHVYIRVVCPQGAPPPKLDRSKLADLACRHFIGAGALYTYASCSLAALAVESLAHPDGTGEWVPVGWLRPLVPTPAEVSTPTHLLAYSLGPARRAIEEECRRRIEAEEHHMRRSGGGEQARRRGDVGGLPSSSADRSTPGGGDRIGTAVCATAAEKGEKEAQRNEAKRAYPNDAAPRGDGDRSRPSKEPRRNGKDAPRASAAAAGSSSAPPGARKRKKVKSLPPGALIFVDWEAARDAVRLVEPKGRADACGVVSALLSATAGRPSSRATPALPVMVPVMIVSHSLERMERSRRRLGGASIGAIQSSPVDVRLTPWTEHGIASAPDTHFVVPRGVLLRFVDGFEDAWRAHPEIRERLMDALLHVLAFQARDGTRGAASSEGPAHWVPNMWKLLMGEKEPLPLRLKDVSDDHR